MPPVHMRKQIIAFFALREKIAIDILFFELVRQFLKARKMIGHSFGCIIFRGSVANEKCPVTGLREKELACELAQDALIIPRCLPASGFCQRGHAGVRREKMLKNPDAFLVEPDIEKTLITPTRCCRFRYLLSGILLEKFARHGQRRFIFRGRKNHVLKKNRSLKPPMPEEFGIKRYCHDWIPVSSCHTFQFGNAALDKMVGMP